MQQVRIMVGMDRREYYLPADADVASIQASITEQLRAGGGFVDVVRTPDHTLSVLVSPGVSLTIEVTQHDTPPPELDGDDSAEVDPAWLSSLDLI